MNFFRSSLALVALLAAVSSFAQGNVGTATNLNEMLSRTQSLSNPNVSVRSYYFPGDWGPSRIFTATTNPPAATNLGNIFQSKVRPDIFFVADDRKALVQHDKWFGVIANGLTDDTASVQAALDYTSPGGILAVSPGTTMLYRRLNLNSTNRVEIRGAGLSSIWKWGAATNDWMLYFGTNNTYFGASSMSDMVLDGSGIANGIVGTNVTRSSFSDMKVQNMATYGFKFNGVIAKFDRIRFTTFSASTNWAVHLEGGSGNAVTDCSFDGIDRCIHPGGGQISVSGIVAEPGTTVLDFPQASFSGAKAFFGSFVESMTDPFKYGVEGSADSVGGTLVWVGNNFAGNNGRSRIYSGGPFTSIGNMLGTGFDVGPGVTSVFLAGDFLPPWAPATATNFISTNVPLADFDNLPHHVTLRTPNVYFGMGSNIWFQQDGTWTLNGSHAIRLRDAVLAWDNTNGVSDARLFRSAVNGLQVQGYLGINTTPTSAFSVQNPDLGTNTAQVHIFDRVTAPTNGIGGAVAFGALYSSNAPATPALIATLAGRRATAQDNSLKGRLEGWVRNDSGWLRPWYIDWDGQVYFQTNAVLAGLTIGGQTFTNLVGNGLINSNGNLVATGGGGSITNLPAGLAYLGTNQTFTGVNIFAGNTVLGAVTITNLTVAQLSIGGQAFTNLVGAGLTNSNGNLTIAGSAGNVFGPASSTDAAVVLFSGTTGKALQNSGITAPGLTNLDAQGNMSGLDAIKSNHFVTYRQFLEGLSGGVASYFSQVPASGFDFTGTTNLATNWMSQTIPVELTNAVATAADGTYVATFVSTNSFTHFPRLSATVWLYCFENSAGSGSIRPEAHVINSVTKKVEYIMPNAPGYVLVPNATGPAEPLVFPLPITEYSSTTNFYIAIRIRLQESGTDPTIRIVTGGSYASFVAPPIAAGNFVAISGDTMTGPLVVPAIAVGGPLITNLAGNGLTVSNGNLTVTGASLNLDTNAMAFLPNNQTFTGTNNFAAKITRFGPNSENVLDQSGAFTLGPATNVLEMKGTFLRFNGNPSLFSPVAGRLAVNGRLSVNMTNAVGTLSVGDTTAQGLGFGHLFVWGTEWPTNQDVGGVIAGGAFYTTGDTNPTPFVRIKMFRETSNTTKGYFSFEARNNAAAYVEALRLNSESATVAGNILLSVVGNAWFGTNVAIGRTNVPAGVALFVTNGTTVLANTVIGVTNLIGELSVKANTSALGSMAFVADAPSNGSIHGRSNGVWVVVSSSGPVAGTALLATNQTFTGTNVFAGEVYSPGDGDSSTKFGSGAYAGDVGDIGDIAIGHGSDSHGSFGVAVGYNAVSGSGSVSIGSGTGGGVSHLFATMVGFGASAGESATAIGYQANAPFDFSSAFGVNSTSTATNQVRLGTANDTVSIPGNLVVDGIASLAAGSTVPTASQLSSNPVVANTAYVDRAVAAVPAGSASKSEPVTSGEWGTPSSNYAFMATTNGSPIGLFDAGGKALIFNRTVPTTLSAMPTKITILTHWRPAVGNVNSQTIVVNAAVQPIRDTDSFNAAAQTTKTCSGQTWQHATNVITVLTGLALGQEFTVRVQLDAAKTATNVIQMSLSGEIRYDP